MTSVFSWQNCQPLPCFILYSKAKLACYSRYLLTSSFCISVLYDEKDIFFWCQLQEVSRSSQNCSTSASLALVVWEQTWITVILNGFPWKRREIILSFLRLHPSTAFWTRLLTMRAAAAAKSLQLCPTLCDPIDGSPPGSAVPGILQARTLEWVAISFSYDYEGYSVYSKGFLPTVVDIMDIWIKLAHSSPFQFTDF